MSIFKYCHLDNLHENILKVLSLYFFNSIGLARENPYIDFYESKYHNENNKIGLIYKFRIGNEPWPELRDYQGKRANPPYR